MERDFVLDRLPHRPPFLFVDGVISIGESEISAYRNIELADEVFKGHFPGYPIYPGVLIIEGMAQTAGILLLTPGSTPLFEVAAYPLWTPVRYYSRDIIAQGLFFPKLLESCQKKYGTGDSLFFN